MKKLSNNFQAESYNLKIHSEQKSEFFTGYLVIEGKKTPPPSKRFTFHQKGLRLTKASIMHKHKKGDIEFEVARINHLKSFEEVRIHTNNLLYPGQYVINLEFSGKLNEDKLKFIKQQDAWLENSWRDVLPCIDEPESRVNAGIEVVYI